MSLVGCEALEDDDAGLNWKKNMQHAIIEGKKVKNQQQSHEQKRTSVFIFLWTEIFIEL